MNRFSLLVCTVLFLITRLEAQTELFPGDLAVISVNANNGFCSGFSGEDRISFVFFKDITPGTTFDLTDNGWERENAGFFGNQEGAFRFTRTGATLPAGTVVTLSLPAVGGQVRFAAPDDDWELTRLTSTNTNVNLNASGDQLIFMQGGTWDNGDTGFDGFLNNARYTGGRFLFAFNTKADWLPFQDNSNDSGLPDEIGDCHNMTPATGSSDFLYYDGPAEPADQLDWISRLSDPTNWSTAVGCGNFPIPPSAISVDTSGIQLSCTVCRDCQPFQDDIRFELPQDAGPYTITLAVDADTVQLTDVLDGSTYSVEVDGPTRIRLLSVEDVRGCAVQLQDSIVLALEAGEGLTVAPVPPLVACDQGSGTAGFNLIALSNNLRIEPTDSISWYADEMRTRPLTPSSNFQANSRTIYAEVFSGLCSSGLIPVTLRVAPIPRLNAFGDGLRCTGECHNIVLGMRGEGPFTLQYELRINGNWQPLFLRNSTGDTTLRICHDFGQATEIAFRSLSDQSCVTELSTVFDLPVYPPALYLVQDTLCTGEQRTINGVVYGQDNPSGIDTLSGASRNGCDSIIQVELVFLENDLSASISAPPLICRDASAEVVVNVPADQAYAFTYQAGSAAPEVVRGVEGGIHRLPVQPAQTTTYRLIEVVPEQGGCAVAFDTSATIEVSDLQADIRILDEPGCSDARRGQLEAIPTGGQAPYTYLWDSGGQTAQLDNLSGGRYEVTVIDATGCQQSAVAMLSQPESLTAVFREEPAVCPGEQNRLIIQQVTGGSGAYRYSLDGTIYQPITAFPEIVVDPPAEAGFLFLDDGGDCSLREPLTGLAQGGMATIDLGDDRVIQQGDSALLQASLNFTPTRVAWSHSGSLHFTADSLQVIAQPERTTVYRFTAFTADGCSITETVRVIVEERPQIFFAPTAFSPNNDGQNDYFTIFGGRQLQQIAVLRIYNRWGSLIFERFDLSPGVEQEGWDGTHGRYDQPSGVYIYQAELIDLGGRRFQISGEVALMR